MGRRSSPNQWPFYRSVFSWFIPWALVAVIVGIGVWVGVDALSGGPSNSKPPTTSLAAGSSSTPSHSPTPKKTPVVTPSAHASKKAKSKEKVPLITDGITVQVLNGTSDAGASDRVAGRLGALGFKIVAVGSASTDYAHTTVFWAYPAAKPAAKALASHFGWLAAPKPANLSPQVAVHVVVGSDAL